MLHNFISYLGVLHYFMSYLGLDAKNGCIIHICLNEPKSHCSLVQIYLIVATSGHDDVRVRLGRRDEDVKRRLDVLAVL